MLESQDGTPITMASLSLAARVSRRTLSTHWNSMDDLLTESLASVRTLELADCSRPVDERLRVFLQSVRSNTQAPVNSTVMLTVLASESSKAENSPEAGVYDFTKESIKAFRENVAPLSATQYAILVGPIVFQEWFTVTPVSDDMIEQIVLLGLGMIAELPA